MATCKECDGRGKVQCIHCYGSGKRYDGKPCNYCKGAKIQTCYECGGTGRAGK